MLYFLSISDWLTDEPSTRIKPSDERIKPSDDVIGVVGEQTHFF